MAVPLPGVVALTPEQRQAIISDKLAGLKAADIALNRKVHPATISRLWQRFQRAKQPVSPDEPSIEARKTSLIAPAFAAISRGLTCTKNAVASGTLAVQVLKGIGVFQPDAPNLSLHFSQPPTTWSTAVSALTAAQPAPQLPAPASEQASEASNS